MKSPRLTRYERRFVLERDHFQCVTCGTGGRHSDIILEVHHIIPRSEGGSNDPTNLETKCVVCHDMTHYGAWRGRPRTFTELKDNQGKRW